MKTISDGKVIKKIIKAKLMLLKADKSTIINGKKSNKEISFD